MQRPGEKRGCARAAAGEILRRDGAGRVAWACFLAVRPARAGRTQTRAAGEGAKAIYKEAEKKRPGEVRPGSFNQS